MPTIKKRKQKKKLNDHDQTSLLVELKYVINEQYTVDGRLDIKPLWEEEHEWRVRANWWRNGHIAQSKFLHVKQNKTKISIEERV